MLPFCHSNGFSDIYKGGDGEKVCKMDVSGTAFDNHPGGTGTDTRADKKGWRAWIGADGRGVVARDCAKCSHQAMFVEDDHGNLVRINPRGPSIWLWENTEIPERGKAPSITFEETLCDDWKWNYVSVLNGYNKGGDLVAYEWHKQWNDETKKWDMTGTNAVFCFYPMCDRLLLAQNLYYTMENEERVVHADKAKLDWYYPTPGRIFSDLQNTDKRPYKAPVVSRAGWGEGNPPFASTFDFGDWRFNPKVQQDRFYSPSIGDILQPSGDVGNIRAAEVIAMLNHCIKEDMSPNELYDWNISGWGNDTSELVMLYTLSGHRKVGKEQPTEEHWKYPLYWEKVPPSDDNPKGIDFPDIPWGRQIAKVLEGNSAYHGGIDLSGNAVPPPFFQTDLVVPSGVGLFDGILPETAFDLRLYCVSYDWKAWNLVYDAKRKEYVKDDTQQAWDRGYFNTLIYPSVRQIVPARPR